MSAAYGLWAPSFTQVHEAAEAAAQHWRALAELQVKAADEAWRLAAAHAERRREAMTQFMNTLWLAHAGAAPAIAASPEEAAHV
ncbi:MAG TPA: hypothetical protein VGM25_03565 [Caulobacteraceae bacterium]